MSEHAKPVKTTALLFAGVLAALCWTVGDMLLVGFVPQPERHPQLAVLAGRMEGDVQMAALMLDAAPACLLWGVLPATFSAPFYLAAAFGVYRLLRPGRTAVLCFALLFCASRCCFSAMRSRRWRTPVSTIWAAPRRHCLPPVPKI